MSEKVKNIAKAISYILFLLFVLAGGFYVGRKTVKEKVIKWTKYEKGKKIEVFKDSLVPVYVNKPIDTTNVILAAIKSGNFNDLFPVRENIIYITKQDTSAVLLDWMTERIYDELLFDIDTVGTERIKMKVQYNRLQAINATFTPVIKNVSEKEISVKRFSPFAGGGITTSSEIAATGGLFFNDRYGVQAIYEYDWSIHRHTAGLVLLYKF